jgi:hypothetical protein
VEPERPRVPGPERALDWAAPFTYVFKIPGGWKVPVYAGLLGLAGFLVLPLLVAGGWFVAIARAVARGDRDLPPLRLEQAWDGLRMALAFAVYFLPLLLVVLFFPLLSFLTSGPGRKDLPGVLLPLSSLPVIGLGSLYGLAFSALQPALLAAFAVGGTFRSFFSPDLIRGAILPWGWNYLAVAAICYGVQQLAGLGVLFCLVGLAFTAAYSWAVMAHFSGQLARPLLGPAGQGAGEEAP